MSWSEDEANIRCLLSFACPQLWTRLSETNSPDRRHCEECDQDVYLVHDDEEFLHHAERGHCVAVPIKPERGSETGENYVTGVPAEPGEWHII